MVQGGVITEESICLGDVNEVREGHFAIESTFLTTGSTHGFAVLSLQAPMPKSSFLSNVSARYAAIKPKSGSSGACGTASAGKLVAIGCDMLCMCMCIARC